jgi:hypothetical protein
MGIYKREGTGLDDEEVDAARDLFQSADQQLTGVVDPVRKAHGLTDEMMEAIYKKMLEESRQGT